MLLLVLLAAEAFADREPFSVRFRGEVTPYREFGVYVTPGEKLPLEIVSPGGAIYSIEAGKGAITQGTTTRWTWVAPTQPGLAKVEVEREGGPGVIKLNIFVMYPPSAVINGSLNGFRIGEYPASVYKRNPNYRPPRGFIEVTKDNADTKISPHFRIKQFVSKQPGGYPKYVVLDERLLLKLEAIVERLNSLGHDVKGLHVMSGYRTPFYNKAIGNVQFSMHQFGGAADIFVDDNDDGLMDDLNGDKLIDRRDAILLYTIVENLDREPGFRHVGGLGHYAATQAHGPFVHVDVRGRTARWAD